MVSAMVDRILGRQDPKADKAAAATDPKSAMWRRVQLARNLGRPRTLDLLRDMAD